MRRVVVARSDNDGDVLLAGPAVRAVAAAAEVVLLVGPRGRQAAALLPGVAETIVWRPPWIDPDPPPVEQSDVDRLVAAIRAADVDEAVVLTSFHQSALPLALLLRLAGLRRITAVSEDYPGSLLDVRHRVDDDLPEAERALSTVAAAGFPPPAGDDGRLRVRRPLPDVAHLTGPGPYVVLHPGASVPAPAARRPTSAGGPAWPNWRPCWLGRTRWWSATPAPRTSPRRSGRRSCRCLRRSCPPPAGPRTGCRACCSATRTHRAQRPGRRSARSRATPASTAWPRRTWSPRWTSW